jgi:L-fuconate dehydratase
LQTWERLGTTSSLIPSCDGKHLSTVGYTTVSFRIYRIGPEKGVIHIASGAVNNAVWDLYAKSRKKPLWKLVVDMSPVSLISR